MRISNPSLVQSLWYWKWLKWVWKSTNKLTKQTKLTNSRVAPKKPSLILKSYGGLNINMRLKLLRESNLEKLRWLVKTYLIWICKVFIVRGFINRRSFRIYKVIDRTWFILSSVYEKVNKKKNIKFILIYLL